VKAWSDEEVSAYLDGALEPALAEAFATALASDPALQGRLEAIRQADSAARMAFDAPMNEAIPDRFLALFEDEAKAPVSPAAAEVVDLASRRAQAQPQPQPRPRGFDYRLPLAAGIALAFGWVGGMTLTPGRSDDHAIIRADAATIDPDNPLFRALEQTPSAQAVTLAEGDAFTPVLSFQATDGRFCREFEVASDEAMAVGVACREDATWRVEVLLAAEPAPSGQDGYVQASGYNAAALDAVVSDLGAGDPLGAEAEAQAMAAGWRGP